MLYSAIFMLGAAYALHKGAHIRTDFFFEMLVDHAPRGMIDSIAYVGFFFPSLLLFFYRRCARRPGTHSSSARPRSRRHGGRCCGRSRRSCRSTCLLLIIQGVSETIKSLYAAYTGIELEHKEKVEI